MTEDMLDTASTKKGGVVNCKNDRGISLLNVTYKILTFIIKERLQKYSEYILGHCQSDFRKGKGTVNVIHLVSINNCALFLVEYL